MKWSLKVINFIFDILWKMAFWEQLNQYEDSDQTKEGLKSKEWLNFPDQPADPYAVKNFLRDTEWMSPDDYEQALTPRVMNGINWFDPETYRKLEVASAAIDEVMGKNNPTLQDPNRWEETKDAMLTSERRLDFWRTAVTPNASEGSSLW